MKMIDVNSIKFQNESNKLELNGPHQSCTTCDDKSLPFFPAFFFLRKKIVSDGEKRVRRFLSISKQYTSLFSITQEI